MAIEEKGGGKRKREPNLEGPGRSFYGSLTQIPALSEVFYITTSRGAESRRGERET